MMNVLILHFQTVACCNGPSRWTRGIGIVLLWCCQIVVVNLAFAGAGPSTTTRTRTVRERSTLSDSARPIKDPTVVDRTESWTRRKQQDQTSQWLQPTATKTQQTAASSTTVTTNSEWPRSSPIESTHDQARRAVDAASWSDSVHSVSRFAKRHSPADETHSARSPSIAPPRRTSSLPLFKDRPSPTAITSNTDMASPVYDPESAPAAAPLLSLDNNDNGYEVVPLDFTICYHGIRQVLNTIHEDDLEQVVSWTIDFVQVYLEANVWNFQSLTTTSYYGTVYETNTCIIFSAQAFFDPLGNTYIPTADQLFNLMTVVMDDGTRPDSYYYHLKAELPPTNAFRQCTHITLLDDSSPLDLQDAAANNNASSDNGGGREFAAVLTILAGITAGVALVLGGFVLYEQYCRTDSTTKDDHLKNQESASDQLPPPLRMPPRMEDSVFSPTSHPSFPTLSARSRTSFSNAASKGSSGIRHPHRSRITNDVHSKHSGGDSSQFLSTHYEDSNVEDNEDDHENDGRYRRDKTTLGAKRNSPPSKTTGEEGTSRTRRREMVLDVADIEDAFKNVDDDNSDSSSSTNFDVPTTSNVRDANLCSGTKETEQQNHDSTEEWLEDEPLGFIDIFRAVDSSSSQGSTTRSVTEDPQTTKVATGGKRRQPSTNRQPKTKPKAWPTLQERIESLRVFAALSSSSSLSSIRPESSTCASKDTVIHQEVKPPSNNHKKSNGGRPSRAPSDQFCSCEPREPLEWPSRSLPKRNRNRVDRKDGETVPVSIIQTNDYRGGVVAVHKRRSPPRHCSNAATQTIGTSPFVYPDEDDMPTRSTRKKPEASSLVRNARAIFESLAETSGINSTSANKRSSSTGINAGKNQSRVPERYEIEATDEAELEPSSPHSQNPSTPLPEESIQRPKAPPRTVPELLMKRDVSTRGKGATSTWSSASEITNGSLYSKEMATSVPSCIQRMVQKKNCQAWVEPGQEVPVDTQDMEFEPMA